MQDFKTLYGELAAKLTEEIADIKWADLWHNQVNFLDTEHEFPSPAVFFGFRSNQMKNLGTRLQEVDLQVDVYLYYETFADTYTGAYNQEAALEFLGLLGDINAQLHGSDGTNYSGMSRVSFGAVDTGNAGNLYLQTYTCKLMDYSAQREEAEGTFAELTIEPQEDNKFIIRP